MSADKLLTVRISEELRQEFINQAHAEDTSARQLLLRWIKQYLGYPIDHLDNEEGRDRVNNLEERVTSIESALASLQSSQEQMASQLDNYFQSLSETTQTNQASLSASQIDSSLETVNQSSYSNSQQDSLTDNQTKVSPVECKEISKETDSSNSSSVHQDIATATSQDGDEENTMASGNESTGKDTDNNLKTDLDLGPLTQLELGKRFGCTGEGIKYQRKKGGNSFQEWSRKKDPDGIAWQYKEDQKYYPIDDDTEQLTVVQIAQYYGVKTDTIRRRINEQKVKNLGDQLQYKGDVWQLVKLGSDKRLKQLKTN